MNRVLFCFENAEIGNARSASRLFLHVISTLLPWCFVMWWIYPVGACDPRLLFSLTPVLIFILYKLLLVLCRVGGMAMTQFRTAVTQPETDIPPLIGTNNDESTLNRQVQQERKQNLDLAREVHTEKAHADRARQEVDALTQTKQAVETAHRWALKLILARGTAAHNKDRLEST